MMSWSGRGISRQHLLAGDPSRTTSGFLVAMMPSSAPNLTMTGAFKCPVDEAGGGTHLPAPSAQRVHRPVTKGRQLFPSGALT
jgi:hypothetical protein